MDLKQGSRVRLTGGWLVWFGVVAALALFVPVIGGYLFGWGWTGIVADDDYPKRTFWDWLKLLIVPAVLAVGGYLVTRSESRATQAAAEQQAQDQALQAYLEQMGQLLLDKDRPLLESAEGDAVRSLARARTLTVLARLDGGRKGSVVRFLYESGLVAEDFPTEGSRPVLDLREADLRGANLEGAILLRIDLSAERPRAGVDLRGANLSGAFLDHAKLRCANLDGADLRDAWLHKADLTFVLMRNADLRGIHQFTRPQLNAANLEGTTMPDGQKYEDWKIQS